MASYTQTPLLPIDAEEPLGSSAEEKAQLQAPVKLFQAATLQPKGDKGRTRHD